MGRCKAKMRPPQVILLVLVLLLVLLLLLVLDSATPSAPAGIQIHAKQAQGKLLRRGRSRCAMIEDEFE